MKASLDSAEAISAWAAVFEAGKQGTHGFQLVNGARKAYGDGGSICLQ